GAILSPDVGDTVTIDTSFEAGLYQVFGGDGTVAFGSKSIGTVYPEWWGAKGDGTDDSTAIQAAIDCMGVRKGGIVKLTKSNYVISELLMDTHNVVLQGEGRGYSYGSGEIAYETVRLTCTTGVWAIRLTAPVSLKNLFIVSNGNPGAAIPWVIVTAGVEYGVLIEQGFTVMEDVTVSKFQYGIVVANGANSNTFERCGTSYNTKAGFAATPGSAEGYACYHPNLTPPGSFINNTVLTVRNCNFRANGWGIILRSAW
ncbi:unnamed protein product, partial [marine sediment metagenome]